MRQYTVWPLLEERVCSHIEIHHVFTDISILPMDGPGGPGINAQYAEPVNTSIYETG